jgi:heparan-alpha-glucosaminide N-acetyltransferase
MIFINYGGGGYAQFEHAPWHGITFADIVFPFFVWMLGTSLVISLKNAHDKGVSKRTLIKKIIIRTIKLFVNFIFIKNKKSKIFLFFFS